MEGSRSQWGQLNIQAGSEGLPGGALLWRDSAKSGVGAGRSGPGHSLWLLWLPWGLRVPEKGETRKTSLREGQGAGMERQGQESTGRA